MAIYGDGKHNENMEHIDKKQYDFYIDRKVTIWSENNIQSKQKVKKRLKKK